MPRTVSHHGSNGLTTPAALPAINLPSATHRWGLSQQWITDIRKRKMHKHMEEIKLSRKVAEFIFALRELSSRLANLHLLEKTSGSSEWLLSGRLMNCDSNILYLFSYLKIFRTLQKEHFLSSFTVFTLERFKVSLGRLIKKKIIIIQILRKLWSKWDHVYEDYV